MDLGRDCVLIISHDVIGPRMAGPGIRCWHLARVLATQLSVTLAMPSETGASPEHVRPWPYTRGVWDSLADAVESASAVILAGDTLVEFPALATCGAPLVVDGYDPHLVETLALFAGTSEGETAYRQRKSVLETQCRLGDFFVCASERQRDWWLGLLEASGRINVATYSDDPTLRRLLDVVPYGLPTSAPTHIHPVLKGVWPGIEPQDKVVLWGGGLWQWLDPLTAIQAIDRVRQERPEVRLVFPGTRHPNAVVPDMPIHQAAIELAQNLGLIDRWVFFGDWVPYEQWPSLLCEADAAISLHLDTVEARLAFRSRVLDYVWAELPMVVSQGDATSELVEQYGLGLTVSFRDAQTVADALLALLEEPERARASGFAAARTDLTWERAAEPLIRFCQQPAYAADRRNQASQVSARVTGAECGATSVVEELPGGGKSRLAETEWAGQLAARDAEVARLQALISGYERGRFMRLMRWLSRARGGTRR